MVIDIDYRGKRSLIKTDNDDPDTETKLLEIDGEVFEELLEGYGHFGHRINFNYLTNIDILSALDKYVVDYDPKVQEQGNYIGLTT